MEDEEIFEENENIEDKLQEFLGKIPDNFSVMEDQIDVEMQMSYFKFASKFKEVKYTSEDLNKRDELFQESTDDERKKELLIAFASIDNPAAFRILEDFKKEQTGKDLYPWAAMALQESRMLLESSLLDTNQVFISTGMGGKGQSLRYFIVFTNKNKQEFNETQRNLIYNEIKYALEENNGVIEENEFDSIYATFVALIPLKVPIKSIFKSAIDECNLIGDFVNDNFIVTNVKKLSSKEIDDFISKMEKEDSNGDLDININ